MRGHYDLWKGSGLSQAQYCRENHIVLRQFKYWISKFKSADNNDSGAIALESDSGHFIPMTSTPEISTFSTVQLSYPNGVILRGEFDLEQLRTLINL
ncbi:MAG: IS66 family insertion sequence element accessory protein TnpA [Mangrovibacterium sp.]